MESDIVFRLRKLVCPFEHLINEYIRYLIKVHNLRYNDTRCSGAYALLSANKLFIKVHYEEAKPVCIYKFLLQHYAMSSRIVCPFITSLNAVCLVFVAIQLFVTGLNLSFKETYAQFILFSKTSPFGVGIYDCWIYMFKFHTSSAE